MLKVLFAFLLLAPALAFAADKPNPADYTVTIHVQSSHLIDICSSDIKGATCGWTQSLTVLIDGTKYEIMDQRYDNAVLRLGDYKARIVKDDTSRAYEYTRTYELLFADGATRKYNVIGESGS